MEKLLPPNPALVKGCELVFPDTVFFNAKGNPSIIFKNDKDFCLVAVKTYQKLILGTIYNDFTACVRERKKDQNGVFSLIYHKNFQLNAIEKLRVVENPDKLKKVDANTSLITASQNNMRKSGNKSEAQSLTRVGTLRGS
jgi:hypothetical protein